MINIPIPETAVNGESSRPHRMPVKIGNRTFPSARQGVQFFRNIYRSYNWQDHVRPEHETELRALLAYHDDAKEKIGAGVDHFEVLKADHGTLCFYAIRTDGSLAPFSFKWCIKCAAQAQGRGK
jgi:hypothetical protein